MKQLKTRDMKNQNFNIVYSQQKFESIFGITQIYNKIKKTIFDFLKSILDPKQLGDNCLPINKIFKLLNDKVEII